MIQIKRHLSNSKSSDEDTKKFKKTFDDRQRISCFEDLSNEVYYEIFDYLDGCQLYEAFSNLNQRFQDLLVCSALILKIDLSSCSGVAQRHYSDIVIPNRHKIISLRLALHLEDDFNFTGFRFDSSFTRLQSLTLDSDIESNELIRLLANLRLLPRLFSLTIYYDDDLDLINYIYRIIFKLPKLKYNKLSYFSWLTRIRLSMATNNEISGIEHLVLDHSCAFNKLISILSYTPRLCRLKCDAVEHSLTSNRIPEVIAILNLTHISIGRCYVDFDQLETCILQKSTRLQVLRLGTSLDPDYLDPDRWERLISQYLTNLRIFDLKYQEPINEHFTVAQRHERLNRFNSSFWIKRKWFLKLYIDTADSMDGYTIIYSIFPSRESSDDFHGYKENNESYCSDVEQNMVQDGTVSNEQKSITLTIVNEMRDYMVGYFSNMYHFQPVVDLIGPTLAVIQISYLNIKDEKIVIDDLINLIKYLPNLDSLVVSSLSMTKLTDLSAHERRNIRLVSTMNRISKVKLYRMNNLAQGKFLLNLCLSMRYFEVDCANGIGPKRFVQFILTKRVKNNPNLSSLCLEILPKNKNLMNNLKKVIDTKQLCQNYTINEKDNRIYLQWT